MDVFDVKFNGEEEICVLFVIFLYVIRLLGLEIECMCEFVIIGLMESVEIVKICLLVMLDEMVCIFCGFFVILLIYFQSGFYVELCDIDYKFYNIIVGCKCNVI